MGNDGSLGDRPQTTVRVTISINPASDVRGDLAGLLGNLFFDVGQAVGLSRKTSSNANIQLVEETTNILEHGSGQLDGELRVAFSMGNDDVIVDVRAPDDPRDDTSTDAWFPPDSKETLATMVHQRRVDRAQGGLGLLRMKSETRRRVGGRGGGPDGDGGDGGSSPAPANVVPLPPPTKPQ